MNAERFTNEDMLDAVGEDLPTTFDSRGYRRLADFMSWDPSCMIFPRLRTANALNLLYLQAEAMQAYDELMAITSRDDRDETPPDEPRSAYSSNFYAMIAGENGNSEQWMKVLELRSRLDEYNKALIQMSELNKKPDPQERSLTFLQRWLVDPEGGNYELEGPGIPPGYCFTKCDRRWNLEDKLSLFSDPTGEDAFTSAILYLGIPSFLVRWVRIRRFPTRTPRDPAWRQFHAYSTATSFRRFGDKAATVVSSVVTTIPVVILYFCEGTGLRLGLIVFFTFLFSGLLTFMSTARRAEVFAAAAAFVAVQVVFVGTITKAQA